MCALCFLWMDVDMCDKGYVWKKLKLPSKASMSQRFFVDLEAPDFWTSQCVVKTDEFPFAILLYDREIPASTPMKQGIWILFNWVKQLSFLSDLHVNMNFGETVWYRRCPTAVLQFHYLMVKFSFSGFYKLDPKWVPERAKHSGRKIWHEMKGPWRLSPIEHNPKITNLFSRRAFLVTPRWWRSTWRFPITDHSWNVDIHARKSKRGRRANVKSNNSRQISQVK